MGDLGHNGNWWAFALVLLTACLLQVLSNLSNEMGDHLSGVDSEGREGPNYSMADGGLTVRQMWRAINAFVIICAVSGLLMLLFSFQFSILNFQFSILLLLGAAAIWAATHYTLGKNPYGYRGLGDLFVFIFFGLVSVLGSYFVMAHTIPAAARSSRRSTSASILTRRWRCPTSSTSRTRAATRCGASAGGSSG